jgi:hypothetical protein
VIIGNVSPSAINRGETISTLKFLADAKCIRNKPRLNRETQGDVATLQKEILQLREEIASLQGHEGDHLMDELRKQCQR